MHGWFPALLACVLSLVHAPVVAAQSEVRGWSIGYADGRVVTHVLKDKGGMWTPLFPKVEEISIAPSGATKYLDIQYVTEGQDLIATVTLATAGFRDRVRVAVVRVRPGEPTRVEQLMAHGVEPVTLSLVRIEPVQAYPPVVTEPSGQLLVRVEPAQANTPIYRFEVVNHSGRGLRAFDFEAYEGETPILSGRRKTERNEPLVLPTETYTFDLTIGPSAGRAWRTLDRIVIKSVMWEDGTVDGDVQPALAERALARSRAAQLRRLLKALTAPGADAFQSVRAAFMALDRSDRSLERARSEALDDLDKLQRGDGSVESWIALKVAEYTSWMERCETAAQTAVRR
jgi:hypothetical protein